MIAMREPSKFLFISGGFFEELQRRKVYRVAAAYIIAAGFIIQMGSAILPAWELPNWTFRLVVVLLLIGFPIALILAWAFDVTSEGIRATKGTAAEPHLRRNMIILVAIGVIVSAAAGFFLLPRASGRNVDKSIAVQPFENRRFEGDFADVSHVVSRQRNAQRPRYWQSAGRGHACGRQRSPHRQSGARQRAADQCQQRRAHLGGGLRPRFNRRIRHSNRSCTKNCLHVAGEAFAE